MNRPIASCTLFAVALVSQGALAQDGPAGPPPTLLGKPGSVVVGGSLYGGGSRLTANAPDGAGPQRVSTLSIQSAAHFDVFVGQHLTVGAELGISYTRWSRNLQDISPDAHSVYMATVAPALRVGWYAPIGERFGLWPMVTAGASHTAGSAAGGADAKFVSAGCTFVAHLDRHWFLAVTPARFTLSSLDLDGGFGSLGGPILSTGLGVSAVF